MCINLLNNTIIFIVYFSKYFKLFIFTFQPFFYLNNNISKMINYYEVESLYYSYKRSMPSIDNYTLKEKIINTLIYKYTYRNYNEIVRIVSMLV